MPYWPLKSIVSTGAGAREDLAQGEVPGRRGVELEAQARVALEPLEDRVGRRRIAEAERVDVGDRPRLRPSTSCSGLPAWPARGRAPRTRTPSCASGAPGPTPAARWPLLDGAEVVAERSERPLAVSGRSGLGSMKRVMSSARPVWPAPRAARAGSRGRPRRTRAPA